LPRSIVIRFYLDPRFTYCYAVVTTPCYFPRSATVYAGLHGCTHFDTRLHLRTAQRCLRLPYVTRYGYDLRYAPTFLFYIGHVVAYWFGYACCLPVPLHTRLPRYPALDCLAQLPRYLYRRCIHTRRFITCSGWDAVGLVCPVTRTPLCLRLLVGCSGFPVARLLLQPPRLLYGYPPLTGLLRASTRPATAFTRGCIWFVGGLVLFRITVACCARVPCGCFTLPHLPFAGPLCGITVLCLHLHLPVPAVCAVGCTPLAPLL